MSGLWRNVVTIGFVLVFSVFFSGMFQYGEAASKGEINLERLFPDYYPKKFDGTGCIDRVGEDGIVIDDKMIVLSDKLKCGTLKKNRIHKSRLREGDLVGYVTNDKGEVVSVWTLQR